MNNDLKKKITDSVEYKSLEINNKTKELIDQSGDITIFKKEMCGLDDFGFFIMKNAPNIDVEIHKHDFIEMQYVYSGVCIQSINEKEIQFNIGDFTIFGSQTSHSLHKGGYNDRLYHIAFTHDYLRDIINDLTEISDKNITFEFFKRIIQDYSVKEYRHIHSFEQDVIGSLLNNIYLEYISKQSGWKENLHFYLCILVNKICALKTGCYTDKLCQTRKIISEVTKYINDNYKTATLDEIAEELNYSSAYLSSTLSKNGNTSFKELLISKRIALAKVLLVHTHSSIEEISEQIGYTNVNYFYKLFKKTTNLTPSKFRKINQQK